MDRIIAKDFAILARFRDTKNTIALKDHYLNDYFLSGICGLGTWGAAWFVDRNYEVFKSIDEKEDFNSYLRSNIVTVAFLT